MEIVFEIKYASSFGENLFLRFYDTRNEATPADFSMLYKDAGSWSVSFTEEDLPYEPQISYEAIVKVNLTERKLFSRRQFDLRKIKKERLLIYDEPDSLELFETISNGRLNDLVKDQGKGAKYADKNAQLMIQLRLPLMHEDHIPCITGSAKKMHRWNEKKPVLMYRKNKSWAAKLNLRKETFPVEYKIAIYDLKKERIIAWEEGENRVFSEAADDRLVLLHPAPAISIEYWKGAGINVPLSAVRTQSTWGCGDLNSLKELGDWCRKAGLKMIQLLPLYDTTATFTSSDSYPYAPVSAFALHPVYLDLESMMHQFSFELTPEEREFKDSLNNDRVVDITEVLKLKLSVLRQLFFLEKDNYRNDFAWFEFFDLNRDWLQPYAAFCYLRDKHETPDFSKWNGFEIFSEDKIDELVSADGKDYDEICFYYFLQFHLHLQLKDARDHLNKSGILLKGDLPIGVGRFSADIWQYPQYFKLDLQAGAPPDLFSETGQNWGFPTYNWLNMESDGYCWWRKRFEHLGNYYDAIRIDHVLGMFRIWSIPDSFTDGRMGYFDPAYPMTIQDLRNFGVNSSVERLTASINGPADVIMLREKEGDGLHFRINMQQTDSFRGLPQDEQNALHQAYLYYFYNKQEECWRHEGERKLTALQQFSRMLLCAEDLGMVPSMVEEVLQQLQILCLRVERMPLDQGSFFATPESPYLAVVTPSTHDMATIRQWWQEEKAIQWYYNVRLAREGQAPAEADTSVCTDILKLHLHSPAMWAIFLLQDLLSVDERLRNPNADGERINVPMDNNHCWNYRMHLNLEDLTLAKAFNHGIKAMVRESGR